MGETIKDTPFSISFWIHLNTKAKRERGRERRCVDREYDFRRHAKADEDFRRQFMGEWLFDESSQSAM